MAKREETSGWTYLSKQAHYQRQDTYASNMYGVGTHCGGFRGFPVGVNNPPSVSPSSTSARSLERAGSTDSPVFSPPPQMTPPSSSSKKEQQVSSKVSRYTPPLPVGTEDASNPSYNNNNSGSGGGSGGGGLISLSSASEPQSVTAPQVRSSSSWQNWLTNFGRAPPVPMAVAGSSLPSTLDGGDDAEHTSLLADPVGPSFTPTPTTEKQTGSGKGFSSSATSYPAMVGVHPAQGISWGRPPTHAVSSGGANNKTETSENPTRKGSLPNNRTALTPPPAPTPPLTPTQETAAGGGKDWKRFLPSRLYSVHE